MREVRIEDSIDPCPNCSSRRTSILGRGSALKASYYFVQCGDCKFEGPHSYVSPIDAIALWKINPKAT